MSPRNYSGESTLPMTVSNTGFMVDRLGQDCAPLQFLRELTQNAIEAVLATPDKTGEIIWDVDWVRYDLNGEYKLCVIDNGIGMTGPEMVTYINQLSSSVHEQSMGGNFGVGAKIAAATRNHTGLVYLSWKDGDGSMIHLWRDPADGQYGLRQLQGPTGGFDHYGRIEDSLKPLSIESHGTKVVLLGNDESDNTMRAPEGASTPSRWIGKYLNTRYFEFPPGITVRAREGWENPRSDTDRNVLRTLIGQRKYLESHAENSGQVRLTNATAHWWILKSENALSQNSGWVQSNGHMAALFQSELYELHTGRGGVALLQQFGIIFGYNRVVIYVEPDSNEGHPVSANTSRTLLVINGESLPWSDWAAEFRRLMPDELTAMMESEAAGATSSDHASSIRERLRSIRDLLKPSRYKITRDGILLVDPDNLVGGQPDEEDPKRERIGGGRSGGQGGRAGDIYSLFLLENGVAGQAIQSDQLPEVIWVSAIDGTRTPPLLEDRAAKYLLDQNLLQINGDFRIFADMIDRWCEQYSSVPGVRDTVQDVVREWFEQALIETVMGVLSIRDSKMWNMNEIESALSEEALSAAVMPRYHIDVSIKRALGNRLGTVNAPRQPIAS